MINISLRHFLFFIAIFISACEDDPVLGPQVSDCAPGDSYCEISIPGDDPGLRVDNPETF